MVKVVAGGVDIDKYTTYQPDPQLLSLIEESIGPEGIRIDRELSKSLKTASSWTTS
jgi:hypothetical protein